MKLLALFVALVFGGAVSVYAAERVSLDERDVTSVFITEEASFSFSPNATGYWVFYTSGWTGIPLISISNEYGHLLNHGMDVTVHLVQGADYIVDAGFRGEDGGSYMLSVFWSENYVTHVSLPEFPVESHVMPGGGGRLSVSGEAHVSFTPNVTGLWSFRVHSDEAPFPLWLEDPMGNTLAFGNFLHVTDEHSAFTVQLAAGVEYTIRNMMLMWLTSDFELTAELADEFSPWLDFDYLEAERFELDFEAERTVIPSGGAEVSVTEAKWFSFTPNVTGAWTFETSDRVGDPLLVLTDTYGSIFIGNDDGAGDLNALINVYLAAGVEYLIWARFWQPDAGGRYTLSVSRFEHSDEVDIVRILPGGGGHFTLQQVYSAVLFTPEYTGTWVLQMNNEHAMLGVSDHSESFFAETWAWSTMPIVTVDLAAGVEYSVAVWMPDWLGLEIGVLSVGLAEEISPISGFPSHRMVVRETDFTFVPYEGGYWLIDTLHNGESDPMLWLLDSGGEVIAEDDDSGEGLNAQLKVRLEAGAVYTVRAGFFGGGAGDYVLTVRRLAQPELARPRLVPPPR